MTEVFNTFWHGRRLSNLELACMRSFISKGHILRVFSYEPLDLPDGVIAENAETIIASQQCFSFAGALSAFSNIFRYKLLLEQGGWWVDADVVCLKREMPSCEYYWAEQSPGVINNAILKLPRSDPICKILVDRSMERKDCQTLQTRFGELGPFLLTEVLSSLSMPLHRGSTQEVYPLHWLEAHYVWLPWYTELVCKRIQNSTFLHLWNYMFTLLGIDPSAAPSGSFLDKLYSETGLPSLPNREDHELKDQRKSNKLIRKSIKSFMAQQWVYNLWVNELGREIRELTVGL